MKFTSKQQYIDYVKDAAIKIGNKYSYPVSLLISQACLENGYGLDPTCQSLVDHMNFLGMKAELLNDSWDKYSVWKGKSFVKNTPEVYNGREVRIDDAFRIYDSVEQCFEDYCLFMKYGSYDGLGGTPRYGNKVLGVGDPETVITRVMNLGYCTGKTYASSNMRIIKEWNLTQYDTPSKKEEKMDINIIKKFITTNNSNSTNDPIAIVIHNTDNFAKGANAYAHAEGLYHGYMEGMSWHYVVDDKEIYQCLPHNRGAWHVGRNFGRDNLFGVINNRNSIGIEMCVNAGYDYEKAFQNTVALTKYLMKTLNIPASKVYQHYDICTKDCPSQIRKRGDWPRFKALISNGVAPTPIEKNYLEKGDNGDAVKAMQQMLIACGYKCGSAGADGDFGSNTLTAVKLFQKAAGLKVDGIYGEQTKKALTEAYNSRTVRKASEITVNAFLNACKKVMDTARAGKYTYGNSTTTPPTADKKISCDRLIAKALYDLGFKDQRKGGETCGTLDSYLKKHGFVRSTKAKDIKKGSIVLVQATDKDYTSHAFVCVSYDAKTWKTDRFDAGSQTRINTQQPLKGLNWAYKKSPLIVYNIPEATPTPTPDWKATGTATATVDDLNVRKGPGTEYDILRTLNKGNRFEIDGKTSGKWIHINVQDTIGWVHSSYTKKD